MNLVKLLSLVVIAFGIQACSSGDGKGGAQGTKLTTQDHDDDQCPQNVSGTWSRDVDYIDEEGDRVTKESWDIYLERDSNGQLVSHEGSDSIRIIVDGKVHQTSQDGISVTVQAFCANNTLYRKMRANIGYADFSYRVSVDGQTMTQTENGAFDGQSFNETSSLYRD